MTQRQQDGAQLGGSPTPSFNVASEPIENIVARIAYHADAREWPELRRLFAQTVHVDYTSLFGGTAVAVAGDDLMMGWRAFLPGFDATQHLLGPVLVETTDDRAIARTHVRATHRIADHVWVVGGRWVIVLAREGAAWRIAAMTFELAYQEGDTSLPDQARERAAHVQ
jgi:hypothetical protein